MIERELVFPFERIRLSHSTLELLDTCERKFAIERFYKGAPDLEENVDFIFGTAWGKLFQTYLLTQDAEQAIWAGYLAYTPFIETDKKNFARLINGFIQSQDSLDKFLERYELVTFNSRPAIELGIHINIDKVFYFVGFLDAVVRHKHSGRYAVVEAKTTGSQLHDISPMYRYSGQGTGYSITLDAIVGADLTDYDVIYPVLQYPARNAAEPTLQLLTFEKTLLDRLQWFMTLQHDIHRIRSMIYLNHFPKRVGSCLKYNRPCPHFNTCHLVSIEEYKQEEEDPHTKDYQFFFELEDLITSHISRVRKHEIEEVKSEITFLD